MRLEGLRTSLFAAMAVMIASEAAAAPSAIAKYKDWTVFQDTVGGSRVCFAATEATDKAPKSASHGDVWFYVTNWSNSSGGSQPSIKVGYELRADRPGKIRIGRATWAMFSNANEAFAEDADDRAIISALRKGSEVRVEATSERNTQVAYHFSLKGSADAIDRAATACR